jgi:DNA-binding transcriptional LysR family regulator
LRIQVTGYDALCVMVAAGLGIGVMPRASAALYRGALKISVVTLAETWAQRRLAVCVRSMESLSSVARLLVEHLQASVGRGG